MGVDICIEKEEARERGLREREAASVRNRSSFCPSTVFLLLHDKGSLSMAAIYAISPEGVAALQGKSKGHQDSNGGSVYIGCNICICTEI